MRAGKLAAFRKHFRECDVLLLDDLHFLASKKATQEEFLHTFDALLADGRQVVVTCDCHPRLADDSCRNWPTGCSAGRCGACRRRTPRRGSTCCGRRPPRRAPLIGDDVLKFLAQQLRGNVRELEGALHSLRHYGRVTGRPIDVPLAREALGDLLRHAVRVVRLADVDAAVCRRAAAASRARCNRRPRAWAVSHPRMVAMFLARKHTAATYGEIGKHFGGRNHDRRRGGEEGPAWLQADGTLALSRQTWRVRELIEMAERHLGR